MNKVEGLNRNKIIQIMKILIIEDEFEILKSIEQFLIAENYVVETATSFATGIDKVML